MTFEKLNGGQCFSPSGKGLNDHPPPGVYIKVANPVTCKETGLIFNAINEDTGEMVSFENNAYVYQQPYRVSRRHFSL